MNIPKAFPDDRTGSYIPVNGHTYHTPAIEFIGIHRAHGMLGILIIDLIPCTACFPYLLDGREPFRVSLCESCCAYLGKACPYPHFFEKIFYCPVNILPPHRFCERYTINNIILSLTESPDIANPF